MNPFVHFVSRKVTATVAVFAVGSAAALTGYAVVRGVQGSPADGSQITTQVVDPAALQAALDDPASSTTGTTGTADPSGRSRLRADLRAAFRLDGDARRDALAAVRQKALAGGYGAAVQRRAERRQVHHDLFLSLLPDNLQADLARLREAPADQRDRLRAQIMDNAVAGVYGPDVQKAAQKLRDLHQS